eukprot:Anaeramoba_ignava/a217208_301.p1 GENE.a217208_301~~a217208_301.p1  ORF type:complete len:916 (+),score=284.33 a217208_301:268-2748(+)
MEQSKTKVLFADVLSVLSMAMSSLNERNTLKYKLEGDVEDIGTWGHEYVKHLLGEVAEEYNLRKDNKENLTQLEALIEIIVKFNMEHNAEPDACDLLMETEKIPLLIPYANDHNFTRVCIYLLSCSQYVPEPEDSEILKVVLQIYLKMNQFTDAVRVAIRLNDLESISNILESCEDELLKKQIAFMLARQLITIETEKEDLVEIMNNEKLSIYFRKLIESLEITEPKTIVEIFKIGDESQDKLATNVDSAKQNLATTFANAFFHAGFGRDSLMVEDGNRWLYKNKDHGMMSAAASLGMIFLWDVDDGLSQIDKFLYSKEDYIRAGALLSIGMINCGIKNEFDPALALLTSYLEDESEHNPTQIMKTGAVIGLGMAYSGTNREDVLETLTAIIDDPNNSIETIAQACLSVGLIFIGTGNYDVADLFVKILLDLKGENLKHPHTRFIPLGLGLVFLGKQEDVEFILVALKAIEGDFSEYCAMTVETCAYTATGNVLKIQRILHEITLSLKNIAEQKEKEEKEKQENNENNNNNNNQNQNQNNRMGPNRRRNNQNETKKQEDKTPVNEHLSVAVIGLALIGMGEEIGSEMLLRTFNHLLQYGEKSVRIAVPLAMGLLYSSNPKIEVIETLSRLTHDSNPDIAYSAILALGIVGAGTSNARIAQILKHLAEYYSKEANHLFLVRISQGILQMGKGTLTINPFYSDRFLFHRVAIGGLLAVLHSAIDIKNTIFGSSHYLLYWLVCAIYPKMLVTVNENLDLVKATVRVGKAVDVVGQAGKPKTITGFQTHQTPVLLGFGERGEMANDEYFSLTNTLEGICILRENPNPKMK